MKKEFIIVLGFALAAVVSLALLPRGVVNSKTKENKPKEEVASPITESHTASIAPELQNKINVLKIKISKTAGIDKITHIKELMQVFSAGNRLDSAAKYAEEIVKIAPTEQNTLLAADVYYQAFGFALSQDKGQILAVKTRNYYEKALQNNPHLLKAKTNMAMTYVGSETPMQGILLLREVLNEDPNYVPALMNMGLLSMQSNQFPKAVDRFKNVLKIDKANTEAAFYLGICLIETGDKVEAKKLLEKVQKQDTDPAIQEAIKEALQNLK
jgi:tetratricopeptide (TPR) repeat protein